MKTVNEVLGQNEAVWFEVADNDGEKFLQWATEGGCKWVSGEGINPKAQACKSFIGISRDKKVGYISNQCWCNAKNLPPKYKFEDVLQERL